MERERRVLKNGKTFSFKIENFEERINAGKRRTVSAVGGHEWELKLETFSEYDVDYFTVELRPIADYSIFALLWHDKFSVELAICVKNERPERWEGYRGRFEVTPWYWIGWHDLMRMDTILDPNSGFLRDDGSLVIQVEIRVDVLIDADKNRLFNIFDSFGESVLFEVDSMNFYASKQMLMLHSPVLAEQLADGCDKVVISAHVHSESGYLFLQLIHGVKIKVPIEDISDVLYLAHKYQVLTVLRQMEVYIKSYSDGDINSVDFHSNAFWMERVLSKNQFDDLQRLIKNRGKLTDKKKEELIADKREILLTLTRAPFTHYLDP